ncbi:MAG: hypothetical protein H0W72_13255 [Planctomycetes bacterium]|nr:hypothetical protein [Planctomycetota bacterium]
MATVSVRKFAISVDPDEVVDFAEKLDWFAAIFKQLGFEQIGHYTFRYSDEECMVKAELQSSKDGYFLWAYVQAQDEHSYRLQETADAFGASIIDRSRIERGSERIEKPGTGSYAKSGTGSYTKPATGTYPKQPITGAFQRPPTGRIERPGTGTFQKPPDKPGTNRIEKPPGTGNAGS